MMWNLPYEKIPTSIGSLQMTSCAEEYPGSCPKSHQICNQSW